MKMKNLRKKSVAVLAGIAIVGAVGASAASLGGLDNNELGADTGDVASCDTNGIDVAYTTSFDATEGEYLVDAIVLSDVNAACDLQTVDLAVLRTDYDAVPAAPLAEVSLTGTANGTGTLTISVTDTVTAESVSGLAISISGVAV